MKHFNNNIVYRLKCLCSVSTVYGCFPCGYHSKLQAIDPVTELLQTKAHIKNKVFV